jgi:hypothetical protein
MVVLAKENCLFIIRGNNIRNVKDKYSQNSAHLKMALKLLLRAGL